jgi:uncharacterized Fe-S cluster-containing radical SAM superfamily protein
MSISCKFIEKGLAINTGGSLSTCGQSKIDLGQVNDISDLSDNTLREKNKHKFQNVIPEECISCIRKEDNGDLSRRLAHQNIFSQNSKFELEFLDLHIGNKCNLKCRMCNPSLSTKWHSDARELIKSDLSMSGFDDIKEYNVLSPSFLEWVKKQNKLKYIIIKGGEPFIHPNFEDLLEAIPNKENIVLQVISNGTLITRKHIVLLNKFKNIKIFFSIEASGAMYKYIRGGDSAFYKALENFKLISKEVNNLSECSWLYTANIYGMFSHDETQSLILKNFPNAPLFDLGQQVINPIFLNPLILPLAIREKLAKQTPFSSFAEYILRDPLTNLNISPVQLNKVLKEFILYTNSLDIIRKQNLLLIEPRFYEVFSLIKEIG